MRLLVECPECRRQYDASRRPIGSRFRCTCGHVIVIQKPEGHDSQAVRRPARRAAHRLGVVPLRFLDDDDMAASAAEPAADRPPASVVLPPTLRTFDEQSHGQPPLRTGWPAKSLYHLPT